MSNYSGIFDAIAILLFIRSVERQKKFNRSSIIDSRRSSNKNKQRVKIMSTKFPKLLKDILKPLPKNDRPVVNTFSLYRAG
ncbi:MAG: hypothetical protein DCF12_02195 [Snowella sp.]|jgi:hypothetical protein|nr:MAG: hypothetical protein DCF12_02195 [Snowella sp.]